MAKVTSSLISLRINGLKISNKTSYNKDLIRHDILFTKDDTDILTRILKSNDFEAKQSLAALLSMVGASVPGVQYISGIERLAL